MLKLRLFKEKVMHSGMLFMTVFGVLLLLFIGTGLFLKAWPLLKDQSLWHLLTSESWRPFKGEFGFLPYIAGTFYVTALAICLAWPLCLLCSIYLFEYAPPGIKNAILPLIDLLAGIPPVVYGLWGILMIVPFIAETLGPRFVDYTSGYSVLAGGVVLSIMIFPLLISLFGEVLVAIPVDLRDASLSLGATKWQTIKRVVLRKAFPGIMAASVLAVSRALGETIAVLMVCGNVAVIPRSLFDSCYPLPALVANNYGEMLSVPMYDSALMLASLILFVLIILFNVSARFIMNELMKKLRV